MVDHINILYISLSGNTKSFVGRLTDYFSQKNIRVNSINVKENPEPKTLEEPFVSFLPAFLKGGNGRNNGYTEILTTPLRDYIEYDDNYKKCYGIVGSGNKNFNRQFALTAKQYAEYFGFPFLTDFELRGTDSDVPRIANIILSQHDKFIASLNTKEEM